MFRPDRRCVAASNPGANPGANSPAYRPRGAASSLPTITGRQFDQAHRCFRGYQDTTNYRSDPTGGQTAASPPRHHLPLATHVFLLRSTAATLAPLRVAAELPRFITALRHSSIYRSRRGLECHLHRNIPTFTFGHGRALTSATSISPDTDRLGRSHSASDRSWPPGPVAPQRSTLQEASDWPFASRFAMRRRPSGPRSEDIIPSKLRSLRTPFSEGSAVCSSPLHQDRR